MTCDGDSLHSTVRLTNSAASHGLSQKQYEKLENDHNHLPQYILDQIYRNSRTKWLNKPNCEHYSYWSFNEFFKVLRYRTLSHKFIWIFSEVAYGHFSDKLVTTFFFSLEPFSDNFSTKSNKLQNLCLRLKIAEKPLKKRRKNNLSFGVKLYLKCFKQVHLTGFNNPT